MPSSSPIIVLISLLPMQKPISFLEISWNFWLKPLLTAVSSSTRQTNKLLFNTMICPSDGVVRGETINDLIFFLPFSDPGQGTWLSISGSPIQQNFLVDGGGLIIVRDISKRKQQEAHNSRLALHDELTGLLSRGLFLDKVADAFSKAKLGTPSSIALLFIDIDRFKTINDSFGHGVGDQLLIEISRRIKRTLRASDSIARLGGDEFAVLLENVKSRLEIVEIVDRLVANVSDSYILGSHEVYIDLSIGIAIGNASYEQPEELVRDADIAMYQAKGEAEVYYKFFEQKMQFDTDENLKIEVDLRNALARHEFVLHYQPIVEIKTRRIIGFEALVRWNHPTLGLLPPNKFYSRCGNNRVDCPSRMVGLA
jgi:diguanylate cyclase (GGDEF)-like protein